MPFNHIKGQQQAINYLKRSLEHNRLAHALLFTGPEGVGKHSVALALAQQLNCRDKQEGDACGVCEACNRIAEHNYPDVRFIVPDGQSLKIDQIREEVQHNIMFKPLEGYYKVYVLDPADALTIEAANSLLKILEEPPKAVVIILLTVQPFSLLETIRSRCQEVRFHPIQTEVLSKWLEVKLECSSEQARTLAKLSGGRPAEALRLAEDETQQLRKKVFELLQQNKKNDWSRLAAMLGEMRNELPEVLAFMLSWFRDLLVLVKTGSEEFVINSDHKQALKDMSKHETVSALENKCNVLLDTMNKLKRNINVQLLLEVLLMKLGVQTPGN